MACGCCCASCCSMCICMARIFCAAASSFTSSGIMPATSIITTLAAEQATPWPAEYSQFDIWAGCSSLQDLRVKCSACCMLPCRTCPAQGRLALLGAGPRHLPQMKAKLPCFVEHTAVQPHAFCLAGLLTYTHLHHMLLSVPHMRSCHRRTVESAAYQCSYLGSVTSTCTQLPSAAPANLNQQWSSDTIIVLLARSAC